VLEPPVFDHETVQHFLPGMAEGGVAQIVGKGKGFGQFFVQTQSSRARLSNLSHLQGMGQTGTIIVTLVIDEDLGLILQPAKGRAVDDTVAIPFKGGTVVAKFLLIASAE